MYSIVKIGDKEVPMLAMASSAVYYKRVFGRDPIQMQVDNESNGQRVAFYAEMGYIMAMMAEANRDRDKLRKINMDTYIEWLDQFAAFDYNQAIVQIAQVYEAQQKPTSKGKNQ